MLYLWCAADVSDQPVGTGTIRAAKEVTQRLIDAGNIVSVGYMLRYLRCVQKMKQIIHENNLTVMATNARYVSRTISS
jgi:predicted dehydrogenase